MESFCGQKWVITGTFSVIRKSLEQDLENTLGVKISQTISNSVDLLLVGEITESTKITKAQELGIKIIKAAEFASLFPDNASNYQELIDCVTSKPHKSNKSKAKSPAVKKTKPKIVTEINNVESTDPLKPLLDQVWAITTSTRFFEKSPEITQKIVELGKSIEGLGGTHKKETMTKAVNILLVVDVVSSVDPENKFYTEKFEIAKERGIDIVYEADFLNYVKARKASAIAYLERQKKIDSF